MRGINKHLKWLPRILISVIIITGLTFCGGVIYFVTSIPSCTENSDAVAYARSLPQKRLAKLYKDMEEYFESSGPFPVNYYVSDKTKLPKPFADLKVKIIRPKERNIMVEGCFDHYVYLRFEGMGDEAKNIRAANRQITLSWGEHPPNLGSEILWKEK